MTTIYAVYDGVSDDFTIKGYFSTKEKAEKYQIDGGFDGIEEHVLDAEEGTVFRTKYVCHMDAQSGTIHMRPYDGSREIGMSEEGYARVADNYYSGGGFYMIFAVSYKSAEHAIELANERRKRFLEGETHNTYPEGYFTLKESLPDLQPS